LSKFASMKRISSALFLFVSALAVVTLSDIQAQNQKIVFAKEIIDSTKSSTAYYTIKGYSICSVDTDGSNLKILSPTILGLPQLFPNRKTGQIAFMPKGSKYMMSVDINGDNEKKELEVISGASQVTWSPDGTKFLYVDYHNICLRNLQTNEDVRITDGANDSPQWMPDGKHCLYSTIKKDEDKPFIRPALLTIDSIGIGNYPDNTKPLTNFPVNLTNLKLSPDGTKMLAILDSNKQSYYLVLMNLNAQLLKVFARGRYKTLKNNTKPFLVTLPNPTDMEAVWSPDGSKISLLVSRETKSELFILNPETGERKLIFFGTKLNSASWSPDGNQLTFCYVDMGNQIWITNADGSHQHPLTRSNREYCPNWVSTAD